ncbi:hypothetical protein X975_20023, partial [Stegodyphus mimosarum]
MRLYFKWFLIPFCFIFISCVNIYLKFRTLFIYKYIYICLSKNRRILLSSFWQRSSNIVVEV